MNMNLSHILINGLVQRAEVTTTRVKAAWAKGTTPLNSYSDVQTLLNDFVKQNNIPIQSSPHGRFWNGSYKQFVEGDVPGVTDPATHKPLKVLVVGNSKQSNVVMALRGTQGSIFDPETGSIGRMPPSGPFMSDEDINRLADWIDRRCPEGP